MQATAAAAPDRPASAKIRRVRAGLGTYIAIEAVSHCGDAALAAAKDAYRVIDGLQALLHPWAAGSDLARIRDGANSAPVAVAGVTWRLLRLARELNARTDGLFDPCLPDRPGRAPDLELLGGHRVVAHRPVALDFGGFAKGYAIDVAVGVLVGHGCTAGVVNAGGDLRVFGPEPCPVLLRRAGAFDSLELRDSALAISDAHSLRHPVEHRGYYNRRSPKEGLVRCYAAVLAPTAVLADALAKCLLLCPEPAAADLLRAYGASRPAL